MSLTFLVPLFLLGVAGIVVPIVLHLTRRRRRQVVMFPSLMFLERIPFQEHRRRRIQHWFLLALRALALALLAVAFARPFLDDANLTGAGATGPEEVVVLLDRSYSMEVGSQWERAVSEARSVFGGMGPLDRASLVAFSRGAQVVLRSTSDPARLRGALDTLSPGSGTTRYGPALRVAQTILEESNLPSGRVVLVSDFQRVGWVGDEGVRIPAGTRVDPVMVRDEIGENVQVMDVTLARESDSGRERVTPTVRVARQGGSGPVEISLSLEVDGQEIQTRTVRLDSDGAASVVFAPFTLSAPHTRGTVRVPADDVEADDAHHFVVSPGSATSVVVVEGRGATRDASLYLRRALETSDEGRFRVRTRRDDGVRPADLQGTDVLILNDTRLDGASAERIRGFVTDGGGVLAVLGESASWPASAADVLPGVLGPVEDRLDTRGGRLGFVEYGHPVFEVFQGPRRGDFSGARFFRARRFSAADSSRIVARFNDGSVAMAELLLGRGTMMVWTSTLDSFWNDLALQPVFLPFVHRLADHLSGRAEMMPWFTTGQLLNLDDPEAMESAGLASPGAAGLSPASEQVVLAPSGETSRIPPMEGPRYLALEERGFYVIRPPGVDPERPFAVAVNVDLTESSREALDPGELVAQITAPAADAAPGPSLESAELRREDQERRQSLWRYLLVAAFALLLLETVWSNWVSRRVVGTPGAASG
jgi:Mg-chelatase subunit ChlD